VTKLGELQTTLTDKTKLFTDKVADLRVDLDKEVTDTTKAANTAIDAAKTVYDDLFNPATEKLATAKSDYQTALDGLEIAKKESDY